MGHVHQASRPTVISSYMGDMGSVRAWWSAWLSFHFDEPLVTAGKDGKLGAPKVIRIMIDVRLSIYLLCRMCLFYICV